MEVVKRLGLSFLVMLTLLVLIAGIGLFIFYIPTVVRVGLVVVLIIMLWGWIYELFKGVTG